MSKRASKDISRVYLQYVLVNAYEKNGAGCTVEENTVKTALAPKNIFHFIGNFKTVIVVGKAEKLLHFH